MVLIEVFLGMLERPTGGRMFVEIMQVIGPVWAAFLFGVVMGWIWRPSWLFCLGSKSTFDFSEPPSSSVILCDRSLSSGQAFSEPADADNSASSSSETIEEASSCITNDDLEHLRDLVERKDGGPPWKHMMDRTTDSMSYQAWQRDPKTGPPQLRSRTVYEDATPELLRDFFLDDEFRLKWDNMLSQAEVLEECTRTGTMVVYWVRKFPFFCSDREYIIGRRTWESGRSFYSVSKGVPCVSVRRYHKPKRVDIYYSSWYIQPVESRKGNREVSACEVLLFHHEDMGIPWEVAKFGVRQGMWGTVKNVEHGFRAYQIHRASMASISHQIFMAQINTKIQLKKPEGDEKAIEPELVALPAEKPTGTFNIPKLLIAGGMFAIACCLDRGLVSRYFAFCAAKRSFRSTNDGFGFAERSGNLGSRSYTSRPTQSSQLHTKQSCF